MNIVAKYFMKKRYSEASEHSSVRIKIQTNRQFAAGFTVESIRRLFSQVDQSASTYQSWGWLPEIALLQSGALLLLARTFVAARAANPWAELFFWIGLAILIVPVAVRLATTEMSRRERIGLIILLGMAFYLVKVMHSPYAFTFPDEFSNLRNAREILQNQRLFQENPELPVTALYPALTTITSLLVSLSDLSIFAAGMLVISAARLVLFLALFLLYEQVSGSARIGSLGTLLYMANPNFLFYTAEFSYESLALPTAVLVLYIVARREMTADHRSGLTVVALLGVLMVVISHHMTSYVLVGLLVAATGISIVRSRGTKWGPWDVALVAALATSLWLIYVATYTISYLSPVFRRAVRSILKLALQEESSRQLFKSTSTGYVSPLWEQFTVLCSVIIIALGLPVGWWDIWNRYRHKIFALLLGAVALAYLPMQLLRFSTAGWETANRSSEFLFIGIAFVLALAVDQLLHHRRTKREFKLLQPLIVVILFFGGFIAGWPPQARMPRPYIVDIGSHIIEPQSIEVAQWTLNHLGPDHRIATSKVGAKLLSAYGEQDPYTGGAYGIKDMLFSGIVGPTEIEIIQKAGIEYIASERRQISWDHMIGLFFLHQESSPSYELVESETYEKFDGVEGVNRILDSGDIVIYDVGVYLQAPNVTKELTHPKPTTETEERPAKETSVEQFGSVNSHGFGGSDNGDKDKNATGSRDKYMEPTSSNAELSERTEPWLTGLQKRECYIPVPWGWVVYTVKDGDTLFELTSERGSIPADIRRINCIENRILRIGMLIWLPPLPPEVP